MNVLDAYRYLYFRIYDWNLRTWGENDVPQFNALIGTTFLTFLSLFNLALIFETLFGTSLLDLAGIGKLHVVIIFLVIGAVNYLLFVRNERFKRFRKVFEGESVKQKNLRLVYCVAFVVANFALFFLLIALKKST